MKKNKVIKGFTLIEALIAVSILGIALAQTYQLLFKIQSFSTSSEADMEIQAEANNTIKVITKDLSQAVVLFRGGDSGGTPEPLNLGTGVTAGLTNANTILPQGVRVPSGTTHGTGTSSPDSFNSPDTANPYAAVYYTYFAGTPSAAPGLAYPTKVASAIAFLKASGSDYLTFTSASSRATKRLNKFTVVAYYLALNSELFRDPENSPSTTRYLRSLVRLESQPYYDTTPLTAPELTEFNNTTATVKTGVTVTNGVDNSSPPQCVNSPLVAGVVNFLSTGGPCASSTTVAGGTLIPNHNAYKIIDSSGNVNKALPTTPALTPSMFTRTIVTKKIAANVIGTPTSGQVLYKNSGNPDVFGPGGLMFQIAPGGSPNINITVILAKSGSKFAKTFMLDSAVTPALM